MSKLEPKVTPRIGLLPTGLQIYWEQYPTLRERGLAMYDQFVDDDHKCKQVSTNCLLSSDSIQSDMALELVPEKKLLVFPSKRSESSSMYTGCW